MSTAFALSAGNLDPSQLTIGSSASQLTHRLIYNNTNGALFFDSDGSGTTSARQLANLPDSLNLTLNNFVVI